MLTLCKEQRLTNFIQGVLMGACVVLTPLLRLMPTSVLWGYFAYLSLESAPWHPVQLVFDTDLDLTAAKAALGCCLSSSLRIIVRLGLRLQSITGRCAAVAMCTSVRRLAGQ